MNFQELLTTVTKQLKEKQYHIATAESCTGGLLAHYFTSLPGSSIYYDCGIITYSNTAKQQLLNVQPKTLEKFGAVSEQTAHEMATNIRNIANTDIGLSTTGIAGPTGGTKEKPIGLVYIGLATPTTNTIQQHQFSGNRHSIQQQTCQQALKLLHQTLKTNK